MSRLSPKKNDQKSDCKREDPVDKDKELRVVELALVAQGVLIVGGHDLLLEVAPSAVGPQQSQRAENHLSIGFTVINEQRERYSQFNHLHALLSRAHLRGRWSSGLLLAGGSLPLEQAARLL